MLKKLHEAHFQVKMYTRHTITPIRRYTDRCVYADTPIAVYLPRYADNADRCVYFDAPIAVFTDVYGTFTEPFSQPKLKPKQPILKTNPKQTTNPKPTLNKP